jgi:hypothetical protein
MTDNFSTSIRDLQNIPDIQEPIQYDTTAKGRLDMDTEIHQAIDMAKKINKKLEDYKETTPVYEQPTTQFSNSNTNLTKGPSNFEFLESLKDFSDKNELITIVILIVILFSQQIGESVGKYIPIVLEYENIYVIFAKATLVAVCFHIIKKLLL